MSPPATMLTLPLAGVGLMEIAAVVYPAMLVLIGVVVLLQIGRRPGAGRGKFSTGESIVASLIAGPAVGFGIALVISYFIDTMPQDRAHTLSSITTLGVIAGVLGAIIFAIAGAVTAVQSGSSNDKPSH